MANKKINLRMLQPTDQLRETTISYLEELSKGSILNISPRPQIWGTRELGPLISDGNNRLSSLAKRGVEEIKVDYLSDNEVKFYCPDEYTQILDRARRLMDRDICEPIDLWREFMRKN